MCSACSTAVTQPEKQAVTKKADADYAVTAGDDITKVIENFKIKDVKGKKRNLAELLGSQDSLIALVKPGCIYCQSMLAVLDATKTKIKPEFLIVLDSKHTDFAGFKKEYNDHKNINATWVYDFENKLHDELNMVSFPRILYLDKDFKVLKAQTGLILPQDRAELEGKDFPFVLQRLSELTIAWMQSL